MNKVKTKLDMLRLLPQRGTVAELGVYKGMLSRFILRICRPSHFYMVDLWEKLGVPWPSYTEQKANREAIFAEFGDRDGIFLIQEDTREFLESHNDEYFDWIYLDSSHQYAHVLSELVVAQDKIKANGYICGHDYSKKIGEGSVIKAVDEFCDHNGWELAMVTTDEDLNSFAIKKKGGPNG
jgi:predicted O-methyltransferase YrrM